MLPSNEHIDVLKELMNIGVGRGAHVLNTMLQSHIRLQVPFIKVVSPDDLKSELEFNNEIHLAAVNLGFNGNLSGNAQLLFTSECASKLVSVLTGDESDDLDLDSVRAGTLCEIGNIVINAVMGTISNQLLMHLDYSVPSYIEGGLGPLLPKAKAGEKTIILLARTKFEVEALEIEGDMLIFLELGAFDKLLISVQNFIEREEDASSNG